MSCTIIDNKRITAFVEAVYKRRENLYSFNERGEVAVIMFELRHFVVVLMSILLKYFFLLCPMPFA